MIEIVKLKDNSQLIKRRLIDSTKTELLITSNKREEMVMAEFGLPESNIPSSPFLNDVLNKHANIFFNGTKDIIAGIKTSKEVLTEYAELEIEEKTPVPLEYII